MKIAVTFLFVLLLTAFSGCFREWDINYPYGIVQTQVVNFTEINTQWDDMNSAGPPFIGNSFDFFLSTNRFSAGKNFDICHYDIDVFFSQTNGHFTITAEREKRCQESINSEAHEYGPLIVIPTSAKWNSYFSDCGYCESASVLFFAGTGDAGGNDLDILVTEITMLRILSVDSSKNVLTFEAAALNSEYDDAYITFGPDRYLYFCSNRNGSFDIYACQLPYDVYDQLDSALLLLIDTTVAITPENVTALNSPGDDKCPYVNGNDMFFVSDRPGGEGGFDIWRSRYENGTWSEPVNAGQAINTQYNEYRPVCIALEEYTNRLCLFSSDRPGGIGGYDIYRVGVD